MFTTLLFVGLLACSQAVPLLSKSASHVSEATHQFGFNLYKQIAAEQSGNVLVSPWSIENLFALAYTGAEGYTAKEMAHVLQLQNDKQEVARGFEEIFQQWNANKNSADILNNINKIYAAEFAQIEEQFVRQAKQAFNTSVESIDFTNSEEAVQKINHYIEQNTNGKIENLIQSASLSPMTRLVLINALYFKGLWSKPFDKENHEMNFYQTESSAKQVPSMQIWAELPYAYNEQLNAQIVQLQYNNTDYSLILVIPHQKQGITNVEQNLPINVPEILSQLHKTNIKLHVPKFRVSQNIDLVQKMQKLGMRDAFTNKANFKGIADDKLYISKAIQEAHIEVNEEATETEVASTSEKIRASSPIEVAADRPFVFIAYKESTNTPIMFGRVSDPTEEQN